MRTCTLRPDQHAVTAVGAGGVSLALASARGVDASEVERALREALDAGIALIDVAAEPDAEQRVGAAVRAGRARDRAIVACRLPATATIPEPRALQAAVEAALRTTRCDALPLAQLAAGAAWLGSPAWPELRGTCARLVREGKVLRWGVLIDTIEDGCAELVEDWVATVSVEFHLCARAAEPLMTAARARGAVVLARQVLGGGVLGGALGPCVTLAFADDRRAIDLDRAATAVARLAAFVREVPPAARACDPARAALEHAIAARVEPIECATVAELALRFAIDRELVALPRLHRREHVAAAVAAVAAPPLSAALARRLDDELADELRVETPAAPRDT